MEIMLKMGLLPRMKLLKETEDGVFASEMLRIEKKKRVGAFNLSVVQGVVFSVIILRVLPGLLLLLNSVETILVGLQVINTGLLL